jgi:multidrug efflux pump
VTLFGLFLTPVFYVLLRSFAKRFEKPALAGAEKPEGIA